MILTPRVHPDRSLSPAGGAAATIWPVCPGHLGVVLAPEVLDPYTRTAFEDTEVPVLRELLLRQQTRPCPLMESWESIAFDSSLVTLYQPMASVTQDRHFWAKVAVPSWAQRTGGQGCAGKDALM